MRTNQVHFDGDESTIGKQDESEQDKKSESEMYERDANAEEQAKPQTGDSASYLFDSEKQPETSANNTLFDGNGTAAAIAGTTVSEGAASTPPGTVIDIVSDPSKADMVIRPGTAGTVTEPSAGEGGGNAEIAPVPAPHPLPNPDPTPEPPPAPSPKPSQPSKGDASGGGSSEPSAPVTPVTPPTASDIENSAKEDTSGSSEAPSTGGKDVEEIRYHESSADMGSNPGIYIGNRENNESGYLYCGQQITPEDIIRSLNIFISTQNSAGTPVAYYFTSDDLGTYLRIDSVTIDGAEIKEYPFTVPENSQTIKIKMSYRLKQSDEWTPYVERDIINPLKSHRVLVLTDKLTEVGQTIPNDWIIRPDRSASERINLYGFQRALYDKRYGWDAALRIDLLPPLRELYTGWTENGEQAPWIYTADSGRHILQPGEFVEVPEGYTVRLTNKNYGEENGGYYEWQTLTDFDESVLTTDENGETTLNVPEYVQAVALEGETEPAISTYAARGARPGNELHGTVCSDNVANYFVIPSTVDYIKNDGCGNVMSGYIVDADNEKYAAVDGILTDKGETEYISIPLAKESITVPETITKVNLPDGYDGKVVLKGGTIPEINFENMLGGSVEVKDVDMMDKVVREYGKALSGNPSTISIDGSEQSYEVHSDCLTHTDEDRNTVLDRVISDADIYAIPDYVDVIGSNAFSGSGSRAIRVSNGNISFAKDCFADSQINYTLCDDSLIDEIRRKMEGIEGVTAAASHTSDDGCEYMIQDGKCVLLNAPSDVKEFRGAITIDGVSKTVDGIGAHAFDGCKKLEYVSLPESVSEIGTSAFDGCTSLSGVMIEGTGAFTIKDHAFDGCTSLRFIGSNAMNMTLENDYNIVTGSGSGQISGELWCPTGNAGYNSAWLSFDDETGITGYKVYEMNGMKVLYGGDGESGSWLAIRAAATPSASTEQPNAVELPADTQEIYISCFEKIAVPYTINWESLVNLWSLDRRAFADSGLTGTMKLASAENDIFLEDYVFMGSDLIEADFSAVTIYRGGISMFADCQQLKKVTFGASTIAGPNTGNEGKPHSVIMTYTFFECNNLEEIAFTTDTPIGLSTYGPHDGFTFRDTYTDAALKITVPEGKADVYYEAWQRSFLGCDVNDPDDYLNYKFIMENQLFGDRMDFMDATWEVNEDNWNAYVEAYTQYTIRKAENMLRGMLGMEKLEELENPQEHKEDYGGNASAGGDPFIWWSAQDTAETPVETPDAAPDDSPPDDPPKLDITISDPSENEIPSISEPSPDAPAEQPGIDAPGEQPSAEPSAPAEQPSAPDTTTENTEPAADPSAAGEGETT